MRRALAGCLATWLGLSSNTAQADSSGAAPRGPGKSAQALYALEPPEAATLPSSTKLIEGYGAREGVQLRSADSPLEDGAAHESTREELSVLRNVERALLEARELSGDLREAAALRVLSAAEQELLGALFVPGVHVFLAEVYMQLALCAAQLDERGLFESALERALSLDPNRRIEAAEAPPAILERARLLAQSHDLAPLGETRVEAEPRAASVWLDGVRVTSGDASFRARTGIHVLVVRAAGHAPYATLLSLGPGKRPALPIALSALPSEAARRALHETSEPAARQKRARALAQAQGEDVFLFELARRSAGRALVQRCTALSCSQAIGFDQSGHDHDAFSDRESAQTWLNGTRGLPGFGAAGPRAPTREERPVWKRWPLWTGTAALVVAGVVTAVWVTRPTHHHQERSLEIDASALPR